MMDAKGLIVAYTFGLYVRQQDTYYRVMTISSVETIGYDRAFAAALRKARRLAQERGRHVYVDVSGKMVMPEFQSLLPGF